MTPATLKTLREALGLSVPWLAAQAGVQERTVRYWESGRSAVPDDVATLIIDLDARSRDAAIEGLRQIERAINAHGQPADPVLLVRYRTDEELWDHKPELDGLPATYHGAICARVMLLAARIGVPVVCEWLDTDAYRTWLKATKQRDTESLRAQFVAMGD